MVYLLRHIDKGYYSKKQPDYSYSWTDDVRDAKVFKSLGTGIVYYASHCNNDNNGDDNDIMLAVILECSSGDLDDCVPLIDDSSEFMVEYMGIIAKCRGILIWS